MTSQAESSPLDRIGGVEINTPQLRTALRRTGGHLTMLGVHAYRIDEAIGVIVKEAEGGLESLRAYNKAFDRPPHNAGTAHIGGSPIRSQADFKYLIGRVVAQRLGEIGVDVRQPDTGAKPTTIRALVDRLRGLALLVQVQHWRSASVPANDDEPEDDAA